MASLKTIHVPHLGGICAAYQMPKPYDHTKPTLLMINAFTMSSELYRAQFEDPQLNSAMNLLAVELLGHGQTRTNRKHWTYWDTAEMNLQVLDALGIDRAFVLGTSQGGWVTVQMALMRPEKVCRGLHPCLRLGFTCTDHPSDRGNNSNGDIDGLGIRAQSSTAVLGWPENREIIFGPLG